MIIKAIKLMFFVGKNEIVTSSCSDEVRWGNKKGNGLAYLEFFHSFWIIRLLRQSKIYLMFYKEKLFSPRKKTKSSNDLIVNLQHLILWPFLHCLLRLWNACRWHKTRYIPCHIVRRLFSVKLSYNSWLCGMGGHAIGNMILREVLGMNWINLMNCVRICNDNIHVPYDIFLWMQLSTYLVLKVHLSI